MHRKKHQQHIMSCSSHRNALTSIFTHTRLCEESSKGEKSVSRCVGIAVNDELCSENCVVAGCIAILVDIHQKASQRELINRKVVQKLAHGFLLTPWRSDSFVP